MFKQAKHLIVFSILLFIFTGCATNSDTRHFVFELRVPKDRFIHQNSSYELIHGADASANALRFMPRTEDQGYLVWKGSTLIFRKPNKAKCTFVVDSWKEPIEIFWLPFRGEIPLHDLTPWLNPNATVASEHASWHAMNQPHKTGVRNNMPTNHFQLRYKIEEWRPVKHVPFEN